MYQCACRRPASKKVEKRTYKVKVVTAQDRGSGTDSNVELKIWGESKTQVQQAHSLVKINIDNVHELTEAKYKCTPFMRLVNKSLNQFQRGEEDLFELHGIDVGLISAITIKHNGREIGAGWKLDYVEIAGSVRGGDHALYFPCNEWLDAGRSDGKIERILFPQVCLVTAICSLKECLIVDNPDGWNIFNVSIT